MSKKYMTYVVILDYSLLGKFLLILINCSFSLSSILVTSSASFIFRDVSGGNSSSARCLIQAFTCDCRLLFAYKLACFCAIMFSNLISMKD